MPRTIDADLLAALVAGTYDVSFSVIYTSDTITRTFTPVKFKLTGDRLFITSRGEFVAGSQVYDANQLLQLVRTFTVAGVTYTVSTSKFFIRSILQDKVTQSSNTMIIETTFEASLAPQKRISFAADVTYEQAISAFCTAIGRTYTLRNPTAAWWDNQFYPTGKVFTTNDSETFFTALKSKYFIFACDNGAGDILFYHALDRSAADYAISTDRTFTQKTTFSVLRYYLARDEAATIRTAGTTTNQMHNLGFLKSTDSFPAYYNQKTLYTLNQVPANLKYLDGDCTEESEAFGYLQPLVVTEIYDPAKSPSWSMDIAQLEYFTNTQGGAMPSTIERVAAYTPLVSTGFDGNLSPDVNNLQALAQAVDDLVISSSSVPDPTATSDFLAGEQVAGVWEWVKKTLAETKTILGIVSAREKLTAARTYYVRTDGNDSNTGLVNSAAGAFLTIQKAIDTAATLDVSIYDVTIQLVDGTYSITSALLCKSYSGGGKMIIQGNAGTPANVVISATSCYILENIGATGIFYIKDCKVVGSSSTFAFHTTMGGYIEFGNIEFSTGFTYQIAAEGASMIQCLSSYKISGGASAHAYVGCNSYIRVNSVTVTISGTPNFTFAFAGGEMGGGLQLTNNTYSGSATGKRYDLQSNSTAKTYGATLPGNAAGTTATGGQYS